MALNLKNDKSAIPLQRSRIIQKRYRLLEGFQPHYPLRLFQNWYALREEKEDLVKLYKLFISIKHGTN